MPDARPPAFITFTCPNCSAFYQVVKVEAGLETVDRDVNCRSCGANLPGRDGNFVWSGKWPGEECRDSRAT
jgi:predicted Zn finger-like uncharacterized protein